MRKFKIFAGLVFTCIAGAASFAMAQDLPFPKFIAPLPSVAYARVTEKGELFLWLLKGSNLTQKSNVILYKEEKKVVNGETVSEKVPVMEPVSTLIRLPTSWNRFTLSLSDPNLSITDMKGNRVANEQLTARLSKETPVLFGGSPVDPLQLVTMKEDTLLIVIPEKAFRQMIPSGVAQTAAKEVKPAAPSKP